PCAVITRRRCEIPVLISVAIVVIGIHHVIGTRGVFVDVGLPFVVTMTGGFPHIGPRQPIRALCVAKPPLVSIIIRGALRRGWSTEPCAKAATIIDNGVLYPPVVIKKAVARSALPDPPIKKDVFQRG